MDKRSFENELRSHLADMPKSTIDRYIESYSTVIEGMTDSGISEEQAVASMGDPAVLAARIRRSADSVNTSYGQGTDGGSSYKNDWSDINDSIYNPGNNNSNYGDGFDAAEPQGNNNAYGAGFNSNELRSSDPVRTSGNYENVSGTVRNAQDINNGYSAVNAPRKVNTERILVIVIACILFLPALIGMYCAAVGICIAGVAIFGAGFWPLFSNAAMMGVLALGVGMLLVGISMLMMMGLNRLIKLVTGHYHLIK